jgi:hypothetical protein
LPRETLRKTMEEIRTTWVPAEIRTGCVSNKRCRALLLL